jgi:hypothetical protein
MAIYFPYIYISNFKPVYPGEELRQVVVDFLRLINEDS